jgi:hypothetical protein
MDDPISDWQWARDATRPDATRNRLLRSHHAAVLAALRGDDLGPGWREGAAQEIRALFRSDGGGDPPTPGTLEHAEMWALRMGTSVEQAQERWLEIERRRVERALDEPAVGEVIAPHPPEEIHPADPLDA